MTIYQLLFNRLTLFIIHFSVSSEPALSEVEGFSVAKNSVYLCESVSNFSLCLGALVAETQSIKIERLCKTNPISEMSKWL
jgi:hypothetical protein